MDTCQPTLNEFAKARSQVLSQVSAIDLQKSLEPVLADLVANFPDAALPEPSATAAE